MKLFIGGLADTIAEDDIRAVFAEFGEVTRCQLITDHLDHSRGFGFIVMATPEQALKAIAALNGTKLEGRRLTVAPGHSGRDKRREAGQIGQ